jgi:hypothetical protein
MGFQVMVKKQWAKLRWLRTILDVSIHDSVNRFLILFLSRLFLFGVFLVIRKVLFGYPFASSTKWR